MMPKPRAVLAGGGEQRGPSTRRPDWRLRLFDHTDSPQGGRARAQRGGRRAGVSPWGAARQEPPRRRRLRLPLAGGCPRTACYFLPNPRGENVQVVVHFSHRRVKRTVVDPTGDTAANVGRALVHREAWVFIIIISSGSGSGLSSFHGVGGCRRRGEAGGDAVGAFQRMAGGALVRQLVGCIIHGGEGGATAAAADGGGGCGGGGGGQATSSRGLGVSKGLRVWAALAGAGLLGWGSFQKRMVAA